MRQKVTELLSIFVCAVLAAGGCGAGTSSLLNGQVLGTSNGSLIASSSGARALLARPGAVTNVSLQPGSLFSDRAKGSLFEPPAIRAPGMMPTGRVKPGVDGLRHLIASVEAGKAGYDAVQHGARIRPHMPPTRMTIRQIYDWIDATPGQPHAIGRYQFIPKTLRRLVREAGLSQGTVFTPQVQDILADILFEDAGLSAFTRGEMSHKEFMNNLAKIWAGLPNSSGKSHYHGYAGNYAGMTWARFASEMQKIFPHG